MSPVRPENRHRYPTDWPIRSLLVRRHRAKWRCECDGRCGARSHPTPSRCEARHGAPHPVTGSTVILTVAHLDHQPEHAHLANLLAMCQACHLAYDRHHHAATRRARRHAGQEVLL